MLRRAGRRHRVPRQAAKPVLVLGLVCLLCAGLGWASASIAEPDANDPARLPVRTRHLLLKAQKLTAAGEHGQAVALLQEYLERHPDRDHVLVRFALGNALAECGRDGEALRQYRSAVGEDPAYGPAWVNLGREAFQQERFSEAGDALAKGFALCRQENPETLFYAAVAYQRDGNPGRAAELLAELVGGKHGPPEWEWYQTLVYVYVELGRPEDAEQVLQTLLDARGHDPEAWKLLRQFEMSRGNYEKAALALTIQAYLTPLTREEQVLLADLLVAAGIPAPACEHYEQALALPGEASAGEYERLASAYIAAHEPEKALAAVTRALSTAPSWRLWSLKGDLLYMAEDFEGAFRAFQESVQANPNPGNGRAHLMMGYCALRSGRLTEARAGLTRAAQFPEQAELAGSLLRQTDAAEGNP